MLHPQHFSKQILSGRLLLLAVIWGGGGSKLLGVQIRTSYNLILSIYYENVVNVALNFHKTKSNK